eukprot:CAMPEP_0201705248 /NCGR_PEP_ID=MMETSP0578-20130828/45173_1 /ASSEMBLY_ACC=CAM_ASM_000663 /TAXON_ID=267565 /ORGANISM="Skeletonema grethea, Strain CCMP 1804" /LENGTH=167 /DNA_ID=CAMNT_0048193445 /DNA_START=122 /DNA_END=621 /DNA_ORIENTATION=-
MAAMAILASCYTATTTYAFAPAATSLLQKQSIVSSTIAPSSLHAFSDNHIEGEEEISFASAVASGWQPERGSFAGITRRNTKTSSTALGMSDYDSYAVIPDGGLSPCVIKVVGVGGGGCNAVDRMLDTRVSGVDFWAINTDAQALGRSKAKGARVLNIGTAATRGLG